MAMRWFRDIYPDRRFFMLAGTLVFLFLMSNIFPFLFIPSKILLLTLLVLTAVDGWLLFRFREGVTASRQIADRFSNGDDNPVNISIQNHYPFRIKTVVIDEIPPQFQLRNLRFEKSLLPRQKASITYVLRPAKRGEHHFGNIIVFAATPLGLVSRRYRIPASHLIRVYPSFLQMRKYELMAISNRLNEVGIKKIRRLGHQLEFELIRDYVTGDDVRTINWKATARSTHLMVNQYQDERAQHVYALIDKSRVMEMPFHGMTLLDYAINASLVLSNTALLKGDKAGLLTFQDRVDSFIPARSGQRQLASLLEILYNQQTVFREADLSAVFSIVRSKISQRSLLLLFTNFESMYGLERQWHYLSKLSTYHLLVVIFFENTELLKLLSQPASTLEDIYDKAIAEKFALEKKLICKTLQQHGIQAVLTAPEKLTINTLNKYLELKARGYL
jgi:uncharacterized protein (DUF58 family)